MIDFILNEDFWKKKTNSRTAAVGVAVSLFITHLQHFSDNRFCFNDGSDVKLIPITIAHQTDSSKRRFPATKYFQKRLAVK